MNRLSGWDPKLSFATVIALHLDETTLVLCPPFYNPYCHLCHHHPSLELHAWHFVVAIILARVVSTVRYVCDMLHWLWTSPSTTVKLYFDIHAHILFHKNWSKVNTTLRCGKKDMDFLVLILHSSLPTRNTTTAFYH